MAPPTRYFDRHDASHGLYFDAVDLLAHVESAYQDIKIIDTECHGRVMLIDDVTMLTQSTHHVYHEHMVHIPMACHPAPRRALVIGGGDGGTVTELVKYPCLEQIALCELDEAVIQVSREWLPDVSAGLSDARVAIHIGDGAAFLNDAPDPFDVIIIDSTDICADDAGSDTGPASPLATDAFYDRLQAGLGPGGVAMQMLGSTIFYRPAMAELFNRLSNRWASFRPVLMPCPFYISGDWTAGLLSMAASLAPDTDHRLNGHLTYFNRDIAHGALALPNDVKRLLPGG
ncbi:MAG: hypothetical protein AAGH87_10355 [Pseudomonadota bacterium]